MTLPPWLGTVDPMETGDTSDQVEDGDNGPKGRFIGPRLKELAHAFGLNQRQLALKLGADPKHFNGWWQNKRRASLISVCEMAERAGRSVAWMLGEEDARARLGTADAQGRVYMESKEVSPGVFYFTEASPDFPQGTPVFVDPTSAFVLDEWLLIKPTDGSTPWFGWANRIGDMDMLRRADGEEVRYVPTRHKVVGLIVGVLVKPSRPLSA